MKQQVNQRLYVKHSVIILFFQVKKKVASGHGKGAKSKGSYARLVKWAEAHGLPASLANNPAKQSKVHPAPVLWLLTSAAGEAHHSTDEGRR
mmetsp:Transcript_14714/g.40119  ORF Transcript_14714/g.40119 Transcript_14714/m.40119 type:complete len:92 (+) Transcript_14714:812-1087(+)